MSRIGETGLAFLLAMKDEAEKEDTGVFCDTFEILDAIANLSRSAASQIADEMINPRNYGPRADDDTSDCEFGVHNDEQLYLYSMGTKKINVIKAIREITGLGLKESKALVESCVHGKAHIPNIETLIDLSNAIMLLKEAGATVDMG